MFAALIKMDTTDNTKFIAVKVNKNFINPSLDKFLQQQSALYILLIMNLINFLLYFYL